MKKYLPYLLGVLILSAVIVLFSTGKSKGKKQTKKKRQLNEKITLRKEDKIPYGTYVAYRSLAYLFPDASISASRDEPGFWDSLSNYDAGQAYIVVADNFNADEGEMRRLLSFAKKGNDVFISAQTISYNAAEVLGCRVVDISEPIFTEDEGIVVAKDDSLEVRLRRPFFESDTLYSYPGRNFSATFTRVDEAVTNQIGDRGKGMSSNFIHLRSGKGNIYVHLAPLAFSNYFLLHKNNIEYYEKLMSVIDPAVTKIVWDEYFMNKPSYSRRRDDDDDGKKKGWFTVLMNTENEEGDKPFKPAFWILILLLLLYVLLEMRRKQRYIPVVTKPRNDSLEFVKTIGRLYYDKGDHKNLARKMAAYFQEHVRTKYKLATGTMDDTFIKALQYKSGAQEHEIRGIVSFIKYLDEAVLISDKQLTGFYNELEAFYKKG